MEKYTNISPKAQRDLSKIEDLISVTVKSYSEMIVNTTEEEMDLLAYEFVRQLIIKLSASRGLEVIKQLREKNNF